MKLNDSSRPKLLVRNLKTDVYEVKINPGEACLSAEIHIKRGDEFKFDKLCIKRVIYKEDYWKKYTQLIEDVETYLGIELLDRRNNEAA